MESIMWLAVALSLGGGFLVASEKAARRRIGFCTWVISNSLWVWDAFQNANWPMFVLFALYLVQCGIGIRSNKPGS